MTINLLRGAGDRLTLRYIPLLSWIFVGLACYGIGTIVTDLLAGRQAPQGSILLGLSALVVMALFVAISGGQLVICRFDRRADRLQIMRYGLHGRATQTRPISEVVGLDVRVLRRAQHRIELRMRSGERLPLSPYYVVAFSTGNIDRLAALLGVEPVTVQQQARLRQ